MKLMYPALTTASLSLTALPSFASPMATAIAIDWAKVAISGGLAACVVTVWLFLVLPPELKALPSFIFLGLLVEALVFFIYF